MSEVSDEELREKLGEVGRLQQENRLAGLSFAVEDDAEILTSKDVIKYVVDVSKYMVELLGRKNTIPTPEA